jgi:hypothetical protein
MYVSLPILYATIYFSQCFNTYRYTCIREILLSGTSYTWSENPLPWLYSIMRNYRPFLTEVLGKDPLDKGTSTSTATELDKLAVWNNMLSLFTNVRSVHKWNFLKQICTKVSNTLCPGDVMSTFWSLNSKETTL